MINIVAGQKQLIKGQIVFVYAVIFEPVNKVYQIFTDKGLITIQI